MRYNPSTDKARKIEDIAAECHNAITKPAKPLFTPDDVFYSEQCRSWIICRDLASLCGDRSAVARYDFKLSRAMSRAMHYRPHQPLC